MIIESFLSLPNIQKQLGFESNFFTKNNVPLSRRTQRFFSPNIPIYHRSNCTVCKSMIGSPNSYDHSGTEIFPCPSLLLLNELNIVRLYNRLY
ncbi:hypothetical protein DERP_009973 [Dermatophagoides pteronyssinus]|uniref:Uncharacterized protein n=1 Tax=Dermatophagoides pteronyssinus TaxID=6956 RepID=A0ABQ8J218_DERPT|nr:hypothetical protein DERP_009973 [Dermatophagoides pteronyssinus]